MIRGLYLGLLIISQVFTVSCGHAATVCQSNNRTMEMELLDWKLSVKDLQLFREIAQDRLNRSLDVLPDMIGCGDIARASLQIRADTSAMKMLNDRGRSPEDYARIGWAILLADDPDFFEVSTDARVQANRKLLLSNRSIVERVLAD